MSVYGPSPKKRARHQTVVRCDDERSAVKKPKRNRKRGPNRRRDFLSFSHRAEVGGARAPLGLDEALVPTNAEASVSLADGGTDNIPPKSLGPGSGWPKLVCPQTCGVVATRAGGTAGRRG